MPARPGRGLACLAILLSTTVPATANVGVTCFPTCQPDDGRFLILAGGEALSTFGGMPIAVRILPPPASGPELTISIFDGDMKHDDDPDAQWDLKNVFEPFFATRTLYSVVPCLDPDCELLGPPLVSAACDDMPDNAWHSLSVPSPGAFPAYLLRAELESPHYVVWNQFKVRTNGTLLFTRREQPFAFQAGFTSLRDFLVLFPNADPGDLGIGDPAKVLENMIGARYDGTWVFRLWATAASAGQPKLETLEIWDGDLDRGPYTLEPGLQDTDDLDTPGAGPVQRPCPAALLPPFCHHLPPYTRQQIASEGTAVGALPGLTGAPPDEADPHLSGGLGRYICRPPSVWYEVLSPDGRTFRNDNPSGNREWERFCISEDPSLEADVHVRELAAGAYGVRVVGMDQNNLSAWYCACEVLGTPPGGCTPGYWKQPQHFGSWGPRFDPGDSFHQVFGVGPEQTLLATLRRGGGGYRALGRHAVAALLNAASSGVDFFYAEAAVVALVQEAYATGEPEAAKNALASANESACPLGRSE